MKIKIKNEERKKTRRNIKKINIRKKERKKERKSKWGK